MEQRIRLYKEIQEIRQMVKDEKLTREEAFTRMLALYGKTHPDWHWPVHTEPKGIIDKLRAQWQQSQQKSFGVTRVSRDYSRPDQI